MAAHTAGDWELDDVTRCSEVCVVYGTPDDGNGQHYVYVRGPLGSNPTPEEQAANARLIVAAPKLLEALQNLLTGASHEEANHNGVLDIRVLGEEVKAGLAAIAKATGETNV